MASCAEGIVDDFENEIKICPQTPRIKPKRGCSYFQEDELFSLGLAENESLGSSHHRIES
jgi:hypothetical protein